MIYDLWLVWLMILIVFYSIYCIYGFLYTENENLAKINDSTQSKYGDE